MDCRTFINQIPQVRMSHCFREVNKCVDVMARKGFGSSQDLLLFDSPMNLCMLLFMTTLVCTMIGYGTVSA